jgi:NAD(P)-dependent dehydrogenase (short-subunit alcohol dehydrogenase family)
VGLLDDKVVLITGAARGQGRAHAVVSAREADVVICDIDSSIVSVPYEPGGEESLLETARLVESEGRRALAVPADVRSSEQLDEVGTCAIEEFGRIDCLVANAGIWTLGILWELTDEQWQGTIDVNLTGVFRNLRGTRRRHDGGRGPRLPARPLGDRLADRRPLGRGRGTPRPPGAHRDDELRRRLRPSSGPARRSALRGSFTSSWPAAGPGRRRCPTGSWPCCAVRPRTRW